MYKFVTAFIIALAASLGVFMAQPQSARAAELQACGPYAVLRCGTTGPRDFIKKIQRPENAQLRKVYAEYGLTPDKYDRFAGEAQKGVVWATNDRIEYKKKIVGYSKLSISPKKGSGFNQKRVVAGKTYWANTFTSTQGVDNNAALLLFDKFGRLEVAILNQTGSPQLLERTGPITTCTSLEAKRVSGKPNTYDISAAYTIAPSSQFVDINFHYSDGARVQTQDRTPTVRKTFKKTGAIEVWLGAKLPNGTVMSYPPANRCKTTITVKKAAAKSEASKPAEKPQAAPAAPAVPAAKPATKPAPTPAVPVVGGICSQLTATLADQATRNYQFVASVAPTAGWQLRNTDMNFGDGVVVRGAQAANGKITLSHNYAKAGTYTATATMQFVRGSATYKADCQTVVTVAEPATPPAPQEVPDELVSVGTGMQVFAVAGSLAGIATGARMVVRRKLGF